jgi:hypothetical protein
MIKTKFKKIESYYDLYLRDDGILLKFNQPDKYLNDLLMFSGFNKNNLNDSTDITLQFNLSRWGIGYTINGWLHWGDGRTTCTNDAAWIYRDTITNIIKSKVGYLTKLPDNEESLNILINTISSLALVNKKIKNPHVFDVRRNK